MKPQKFIAKLSEKKDFNEKFSKYVFELDQPHRMEFEAGQYVSIAVDEEGTRRSYSICSNPDTHHSFELLIDHGPDGKGTNFFKKINFGDEVDVMGPMGHFVLNTEDFEVNESDRELIFIATGSGIAPLRSMILHLLQNLKEKRPITLYWGLRHVQNMFWENEFQDLVELYDNFKFHPVLSQAVEEWPLCKGRVTDCLKIHDLPANGSYYLCGGSGMVNDVSATLQDRGVKKDSIHFEKYN
jgi:NAD(P)H-flavin reductase